MIKSKVLRIGILIGAVGALISAATVSNSYFEVSKNLDIYTSLFKELNIYYVDETKPGELTKTAIDAMLESLDPYTVYYPESDIEDYLFMTTGQYGGIGSLIRKQDEYTIIAEPYEGNPAEEAGLKAGDRILSIDGNDCIGISTDEVSKMLKGQPGTALTIEVDRPSSEENLTFEVVRKEVKIKDVPYYGMLDSEIGYIKLNSFTETASREVISAFKDLKEKNGMKKLVFDLRGNGGGLLREAVNIVNIWVPQGQTVVQTKGKIQEWDQTHRTLNQPVDTEIPIVILIDGGSASASEIVAGTLQDLDRAVVIGQNSYGKGLVQQTRDLSYNAKLKITIAKYYIPSGRCIQRIDYSHKDGLGQFETVPDSLKSTFSTRNGRKVTDGEGIDPDVEIDPLKASAILQSLASKQLVFDYATQYANQHDSIAPANTFSLTDQEYEDFVSWLSDKDYSYTTRSEKLLEDFAKAAEKEKYFDELKESYEQLEGKMDHNKSQDLYTHREQIQSYLENEIVSRYYYQVGRIEASLRTDEEISKSKELLSSSDQYKQILQPNK